MDLQYPPEALAGARITIDLNAMAKNWQKFAELAPKSETGAVVKANAYGLGLEQVAPALWKAGCRTFFVALVQEGINVRQLLPEARIFILGGLFPDAASACIEHDLIPLLGSHPEIETWHGATKGQTSVAPCGIQTDTGMNRLGFSFEEAMTLLADPVPTKALNLQLIMSHIACGDEPDDPLNALQLERFKQIRDLVPSVPASLANSAGIQMGDDYHFDLNRAGTSLYGVRAVNTVENPSLTVVTLEGRIVQTRQIKRGDTIGYGATQTVARDTKVAIVSCGYADGFHRAASGSGVGMRYVEPGASGFVAGKKVPILGRVSMDLTAFDITDVGETEVMANPWIEMFGDNIEIDDVAKSCGTIGYELLVSLGNRAARNYTGLSDIKGA